MKRAIEHRGPDARGTETRGNWNLLHTRLSIIDTDPRANQPMSDPEGRYTLVFNGEIYNFRQLRNELNAARPIDFTTAGDTEVLLHGLIRHGEAFIQKINGFFAFAFYDAYSGELLLVRDRFGIKPLYYHPSAETFVFGSNLAAVMAGIDRKNISAKSLSLYFQLSYIPAPYSILEDVYKLEPGHLLKITADKVEKHKYYHLKGSSHPETTPSFSEATARFSSLLEASVERRLVADVPLGGFLSGGIDSSVIALLIKAQKPDIPVFSIGFPDRPFFDESQRAARIAGHLGLQHHVFEVRDTDIDERLNDILDAFDEPFADSSAVLVSLLAEQARKDVRVVLSGDGSDEILGGYNKHRALLRSLDNTLINRLFKAGSPLLKYAPESRNGYLMNVLRQAKRYSQGLNTDFAGRYKAWASFTPGDIVKELLREPMAVTLPVAMPRTGDFNTVLQADLDLILPNDMLYKVDLMTMQHALEARVPFLDHTLVEYVFSLPSAYKIEKSSGKRILKNAFGKYFPDGAFSRPKKGFEAPLSHWLRGPLSGMRQKYFSTAFIRRQGLFDDETVRKLEKKALGHSPGDTPHTVWALLVFQHWYVRYFNPNPH